MNVLDAIRTRRSVRRYKSDPLGPDVLAAMRQALRLAPSAGNNQPWHFVLVTRQDLRRRLAREAARSEWIGDAPVLVVACGLPERAYQHMGGSGNSVDVDVAIALDHLTLAAVEAGLGTCWIGAFDEAAVKRLLGVPTGVRVIALTPLGTPAGPELNHPVDESRRKPEGEIFSQNTYAGPAG